MGSYQRRGNATGCATDGCDPGRVRLWREGVRGLGATAEEDAVIAWKVDSLRQAGTDIMGRLTYEAMAAVWPTANGVYSGRDERIPKVVFSATLTHADWGQTRMANGDLVNDIGRLNREVGGPILAHGGRPSSSH